MYRRPDFTSEPECTRWSLPNSPLQAQGQLPEAYLAHPEPSLIQPGASQKGSFSWSDDVWGQLSALGSSQLPECSSWTPPLCPFQLLFSLHTLPCVPSPGLASPLFLLRCCRREVLNLHIWLCHAVLINTSVTFHCPSSVARQVLLGPAPPCLLSRPTSHSFEPFVSNPTKLAFSTSPQHYTASVPGT